MLGLSLLLVSTSSAYKILYASPVDGKSHFMFMQSIINALLDRHHEVTGITYFAWPEPRPTNYTEILIEQNQTDSNNLQKKIFAAQTKSARHLLEITEIGERRAEISFNSPDVQRFLHRNDLNFDLVLIDEIQLDSFLMFGHKFKAPIIIICKYFIFPLKQSVKKK